MSNQQFTRTESASTSPADLIARSPAIGWIYLIAAGVSLASATLLLHPILVRPTPFAVGMAVACLFYSLLCGWCWMQRHRRSVRAIGVFAWATMTFIGAAAVPQRVGLNTVGFMVLPVFLFMIAVLGHRRLSITTLAYAAVILLGVWSHHALQLVDAVDRSSQLSHLILASALALAFTALGDQVAQVVAAQVAQARRVASDYRVLFARLPVGAILHRNREIIECNEAANQLMGVKPGTTLIGRDVMSLLPESERAAVHTRLAQLSRLSSGEQLPLRDLEMRGLDGRLVPVSASAVALDPAKGLTLVLVVDRSGQEHAQRELQRSQRLVQALFRVSTHTMAVTDRQSGEFLLVNPAYAQMVGRTPEEMIGRTVMELGMVSPQQRAGFVAALPEFGTVSEVHLPLVDTHGRQHILRQSVVGADFDGRRVLVGVGQDVTEEAQREREFRVILASAPAAIYLVRHGMVTAASAQYERLLGLPVGAAVGRPYEADVGGPDAMAQVTRRHNAMLRTGQTVSFEHEVFRADGSTFPGQFTGRLIKPGARDGFGMVWVIEDLTERRERESKLSRAKADAEAASRAKTGFLATMSHEIRTPLNGILGLIELVRDPSLGAAERQGYLDLMGESALALQEIVSDVLDVSRIESGRLALQIQEFELGPWLASVRAAFFALAEAKGLVLDVQADQVDLGWVRGDPTRLRQILSNFLSNALKFTLQGRISVKLIRLDAQRIRLEVQDSGIGIEPDALGRLFLPYSQVMQAIQAMQVAPAVRGSGLGLSICRQLAELMGGTAGASSEHGRGSCFWAEVDLPALSAGRQGKSQPVAQAVNLSGLRLLVVDDNRINLVVARQLLERAGARVDTANGGEAGLAAFDKAHAQGQGYDLVLMDVQMPGMDGLQALAELRTRPHGRTIPVLAVSAAVTTEEVDLTRAAGFDGFVSKPLELDFLLRAVAEAPTRTALRY